jgi:hypothetical protein
MYPSDAQASPAVLMFFRIKIRKARLFGDHAALPFGKMIVQEDLDRVFQDYGDQGTKKVYLL